MIFFWISSIISTFFAFLYPAYNTFKTVLGRPGHEHEYGRWMMYWCIIAIVVAWEYSFEWVVRWIWGYHELKTLFLLFLVLPQTQGSTYIFTQFLLPTLLRHEADIDHQLASLKSHFLGFLARQIQNVVDAVLGKRPVDGKNAPGTDGLVQGLWQSFGASVLANGAAILQAAQQNGVQQPAEEQEEQEQPQKQARPQNSRGGSGISQRSANSSQSQGLPKKPAYLKAPSTKGAAPPPYYPIPNGPSRSASSIAPNADLPVHPAPFYTYGHSQVKGE
ncbi:hypothetical protein FRC02_011965 [Tulasnella sp. 418]|nr:hypothetical protein FRC02_011965 [Tulasnella sp. 418]